MRVKRLREHRRNIAFFRTALGFRPPFKVLFDGNFIHHCISLRLTAPDVTVPKLLGAPTRVYTTRCVLAELQRLGAAVKDARLAARKMDLIDCYHEEQDGGKEEEKESNSEGGALVERDATEGKESVMGVDGENGSQGGEKGGDTALALNSGEKERAGQPPARVQAHGQVKGPKEGTHGQVKGQRDGSKGPVGKNVTVSASECLHQLVAGANQQHYFVATQDVGLIKRMRKLPSSAVIHAKGTSVALLPPSRLQLSSARASEAARRVLPEHEIEQLKRLRAARKTMRLRESLVPKEVSVTGAVENGDQGGSLGGVDKDGGRMVHAGEAEMMAQADGGTSGEGNTQVVGAAVPNGDARGNGMDMGRDGEDSEGEGRERKDWRRQGYVKDKARFKRNFVKGPNPLSCKKKSKAAAAAAAAASQQEMSKPQGRSDPQSVKNRPRRRKR